MSAVQPRPSSQPPSTTQPAAPPRDVEREFVRGNREGQGGTSETYTVCRLRVSQQRLDEEMKLGLHSHFVSLPQRWNCPAHIFLKASQKARQRQQKRQVQGQRQHSPPTVASLAQWRASRLMFRPAETLEILQKDPDRPGGASTYTICRIAVPRERMVSEVLEGLHPGYHVRQTTGGDRYVKGNPTEPFDNVDFPKSRKARPGFAPRELCPFRLLGPGTQL